MLWELVYPASASLRSPRNCVTLCDFTRRNNACLALLEGSPGRYPQLLLTGHRCDVFEVGVVVQYGRSIVFGDRGGQQIDNPGGAMLAANRHSELNLPRMIGNRLRDRQVPIQRPPVLRDD